MKPRLTQRRTLAAIDQTCKLFEIPARQLLGRGQQSDITRARFALYASLYQTCETSFYQVATLLKRDHSTVIHGYKRAVAMAKVDPEYADAIAQIAGVLQ